jgi:uncharacterized membrane protein YdjX (TVP38/TMEM64 family)
MSMRGIVILAVVLVLAAGAWATGLLDRLQDVDAIRATIEAAGAWGPVLYIAVAMASFAVFLLSFPVWAATVIWPLPEAFAYSFIASLLGSVLTYGLTFALGRTWARERVPQSLAAWEARLEARPFVALVTLRFLLWANPLVDMLLAVSRVPPRTYLLGTAVGLLWPTAFQVGVGAGGGAAIAWLGTMDLPWWQWVLLSGAVAGVGLVGVRLRRVRRVRQV